LTQRHFLPKGAKAKHSRFKAGLGLLADRPAGAACRLVMTCLGVCGVESLVTRLLLVIAVSVVVVFTASCGAGAGHPAASPAPLPPDPHTASALLRIATAFNHDYDTGEYGPVYARWDARSQAIISRANYIRRHRDCPGAPHVLSRTETVSPGLHGVWLVHYEIGGQQLTDYWFYVRHRWVFDLVLSNPDAVKLYRMSPQQYAAAVGCAH
jgi:hypothetical protein